MDEKRTLNIEDIQVTSFATTATTSDAQLMAVPAESWPAMCTCIGICQPSEDLYCSGGCGPIYAY